MTIDKAKLKQLLSAQVSLHKVAKETGTIEDENVYLNADDALNEYLDDRGIYIEDVALALLAEIDQLKAENEALRKDAERYRRITENADVDCRGHEMGREYGSLDECIDAAMAKEASHG